MLHKQLIYDKPLQKGTTYYVMELINEDIENNTDNPNNVHHPRSTILQNLSIVNIRLKSHFPKIATF